MADPMRSGRKLAICDALVIGAKVSFADRTGTETTTAAFVADLAARHSVSSERTQMRVDRFGMGR